MQILLYIIVSAVLFFIIKNALLIRSIKHYSPVDASQKLKKGTNAVLLDVRTFSERKKKSIQARLKIKT